MSLIEHIRNNIILDRAHAGVSSPQDLVAVGGKRVDARLGGGLSRAALHEIYAGTVEDSSAAAGFALLLAMRGVSDGPVLWVREQRGERRAGRVYGPGLAELGIDPGKILLVTAPDAMAVLRAGADIVNCNAVGAVILEPWGKAPVVDLTATRRLALAAARSGVMTLMLRIDAAPQPSAATTRWQVAAAPSRALEANAPGGPVFDIELLRHRNGIAGFAARVEWDSDSQAFRDTPLSGGIPAPAFVRAGVTSLRRAA